MLFNEKDIERFWKSVDIRSEDECWLWNRFLDATGYGRFRFYRKDADRIHICASKASYMITHNLEEIPKGYVVCHKCDHPPCVNPNHLWLGTFKENMEDAVKKQRMARGSKNKNSKLTEAEVQLMHNLYKQGGYTWNDLIEAFGVSKSTVWRTLKGHTFNHVEKEGEIPDSNTMRSINNARISGADHKSSRISEKQVEQIFQMYYVEGLSQNKIAKLISFPQSQICLILNCKSWKNITPKLKAKYEKKKQKQEESGYQQLHLLDTLRHNIL